MSEGEARKVGGLIAGAGLSVTLLEGRVFMGGSGMLQAVSGDIHVTADSLHALYGSEIQSHMSDVSLFVEGLLSAASVAAGGGISSHAVEGLNVLANAGEDGGGWHADGSITLEVVGEGMPVLVHSSVLGVGDVSILTNSGVCTIGAGIMTSSSSGALHLQCGARIHLLESATAVGNSIVEIDGEILEMGPASSLNCTGNLCDVIVTGGGMVLEVGESE